uniref:Uncharacterized protein n=1 Tax=Molossus molossus TaxID=27622 RepID=A0A7J8DQP9_MOLMO|nr:hypothetical protein HJG59_009285 [Molossus molossus]
MHGLLPQIGSLSCPECMSSYCHIPAIQHGSGTWTERTHPHHHPHGPQITPKAGGGTCYVVEVKCLCYLARHYLEQPLSRGNTWPRSLNTITNSFLGVRHLKHAKLDEIRAGPSRLLSPFVFPCSSGTDPSVLPPPSFTH